MADDRIMDIPFERLRNRQQRGIVCGEAIRARRGGRLDTTENNLIRKVDDIIRRINQRGEVTDYYIGKAFVDQRGRNFNRGDPATWDLAEINRRWEEREEENYNGLIVLTVIDEDAIRRRNTTHQDFALALEQRLIHHYRIHRDNARIRNHNFREGRRGDEGHPGYAVYIAVRIAERRQGGGRGGGRQRRQRRRRRRRGQ